MLVTISNLNVITSVSSFLLTTFNDFVVFLKKISFVFFFLIEFKVEFVVNCLFILFLLFFVIEFNLENFVNEEIEFWCSIKLCWYLSLNLNKNKGIS